MAPNWTFSLAPGVLGVFLYRLIKRQDSLDPFSPHFAGSKAMDELESHIDQQPTKKDPKDAG